MLETIANQFGGLLKVDDFTTSLSRSKYAQICVEIDLSKPLSCGFWIGDDLHRVFVVVQYERLPTFCYSCGMIRHSSNSCSRFGTTGAARTKLPQPTWSVGTGSSLVPVDQDQRMDDDDPPPDHHSSESMEETSHNLSNSDYGPSFWSLAGEATLVVAEAAHTPLK